MLGDKTLKIQPSLLISEPEKSETWSDSFSADDFLIKQNILYVNVFYEGGCDTVFFKLNIVEDNKKAAVLALQCNDKDPCRRLIKKQLAFDISNFTQKKALKILFPQKEVIYN